MTTPNLTSQWQGWQTHPYQQSPLPPAQAHHGYQQTHRSEYAQYMLAAGTFVQPRHGNTSNVHIIAELPAPLPTSLSTTPPDEQLKQDEPVAHRMDQMEIGEVRRKSDTTVVQRQRPISMTPQDAHRLSPQLLHQQRSAQLLRPHSRSFSSFPNQRPISMVPANTRPLVPLQITHHRSAQSLRPHSQSVGAATEKWSPGSFALPISKPSSQLDLNRYSTLPEVVVEPPLVSNHEPKSQHEDFPIPVLLDQKPTKPPSIMLNPSSLPTYLEGHRQAPYPPQWNPPPVISSFYAHRENKPSSGSSWLDTPSTCTWKRVRRSDPAQDSVPPTYSFKFKTVRSSFRAPKFSWTMTSINETTEYAKRSEKDQWAYELKLDSKSNMRKSEVLVHGTKGRPILTTYVHALSYDSLHFIGPDGRAYTWVTSSKLSSINGARYDTLRHALFVTTGNIPDPLSGQIVADHCFWDGHVDGFGVSLPDEALHVRASNVDPALVVATLQVMKDWEKHTLRGEKRKNPEAFAATEEEARKSELGAASYWKA
ncbi:endoglucanase-1 precursor [Pyrenophora seminiperda CCB06]|uniref:Endoglucanase-1 n=1 Tax=Pyrenophora seminiperda CCB06 TaxID=1302712 RepID=A0A3M7LYM4_9PLEO|nr:endoglucanase-1 precursor [Pyrenophora seminiperda CCB06]